MWCSSSAGYTPSYPYSPRTELCSSSAPSLSLIIKDPELIQQQYDFFISLHKGWMRYTHPHESLNRSSEPVYQNSAHSPLLIIRRWERRLGGFIDQDETVGSDDTFGELILQSRYLTLPQIPLLGQSGSLGLEGTSSQSDHQWSCEPQELSPA